MRLARALIVGVAVLGSSAVAADEVTLRDFFGHWRGTEIVASGAQGVLDLETGDLSIEISANGQGFQIQGLDFARRMPEAAELVQHLSEASFAATDRPGVFAFDPGGSLFSSLFADPAIGNPLEGDVLLWARLAGATLHLYSLAIDAKGGFVLEQATGTLDGDLMTIHVSGRMENEQLYSIEGRVERVEG